MVQDNPDLPIPRPLKTVDRPTHAGIPITDIQAEHRVEHEKMLRRRLFGDINQALAFAAGHPESHKYISVYGVYTMMRKETVACLAHHLRLDAETRSEISNLIQNDIDRRHEEGDI